MRAVALIKAQQVSAKRLAASERSSFRNQILLLGSLSAAGTLFSLISLLSKHDGRSKGWQPIPWPGDKWRYEKRPWSHRDRRDDEARSSNGTPMQCSGQADGSNVFVAMATVDSSRGPSVHRARETRKMSRRDNGVMSLADEFRVGSDVTTLTISMANPDRGLKARGYGFRSRWDQNPRQS